MIRHPRIIFYYRKKTFRHLSVKYSVVKMAKLEFLFVIFIVAASASFAQQSPFVLGGSNAVPNEFPFMVSLQWNLFGSAAHFCGGVILNNVWILTVRIVLRWSIKIHKLKLTTVSALHRKRAKSGFYGSLLRKA